MAENPTVVTINGTDYYVPKESIDDLVVIGNRLVNIGNSTVYLYGNFREYNNNTSGYPRITCQSNYYCYITSSYNAQSQTLNVSSYEIKNRSFDDVFLMLTIVIGILSMMLFKRR